MKSAHQNVILSQNTLNQNKVKKIFLGQNKNGPSYDLGILEPLLSLINCVDNVSLFIITLQQSSKLILKEKEKVLRPEKFEVDPGTTNSTKRWQHWLKTFENFLELIAQQDPDKRKVLITFSRMKYLNLSANLEITQKLRTNSIQYM